MEKDGKILVGSIGAIRRETILKAFDTDIEKAKAGTYADTAENRKLNRVGQKFGAEKKDDSQSSNNKRLVAQGKYKAQKEYKQGSEKKLASLEEHARNTSEEDLKRAASGKDEKLRIAAKKELERRESEHKPEDVEKKETSAGTEKEGVEKTDKTSTDKKEVKLTKKDTKEIEILNAEERLSRATKAWKTAISGGDIEAAEQYQKKMEEFEGIIHSNGVNKKSDLKKSNEVINAEEKYDRAKKAWKGALAQGDIEAAELYRGKMKEFFVVFSKRQNKTKNK